MLISTGDKEPEEGIFEVPASVRQIYTNAFEGCARLKKIIIHGDKTILYDLYTWPNGYAKEMVYQSGFPNLETLSIVGQSGSPAEEYATKHGIKFEKIKNEQ